MISSTFTDLEEHRSALIKAIKGQGFTDIAMENYSAKAGLDVIDSSLQMVRDSSAYIGIISRKYGQTPKCPKRNLGNLSITELEFNEAQRLNRPILLFIMGDQHQVIEADVETNATKRRKLKAFRERAKKMKSDSEVHRVYATFESLEEFKVQSVQAVADLRRYLDEAASRGHRRLGEVVEVFNPIPAPPAFYAEPRYSGSHKFLGRKAELERLNDWASPADSHPVMLFEAIGGTGKSLLTWEWATKHAVDVREDWAGCFWYSFYEKGSMMADFCRRALAYITRQSPQALLTKKTTQLGEMLLRHLQTRPWLFILDGLERVLVAYNRFDAAQVADEEAGSSDQIAHRDPCAAIRPEDDELLRALAAAAPSKLILTSRLVPRVLLNPASQPIPGVLRVPLSGLRPQDAEELLRSCGVTGSSQVIQHYLKSHCDCHPLVIGVLAGLINDYLPDRGNFDAWAADPEYGGQLNLANLDLVQKRNHILHAALNALPEKSRQLLSTMALLSEAVDYPTLIALNPHLPEPEEVPEPENPEKKFWFKDLGNDEQEKWRKQYQIGVQRRKEYEQALTARSHSPEFLAAQQELTKTVRDLERRGLLQYDAQTKRHDLHPVVRGIAAGRLEAAEREHYGQRVVDHFSRHADNPYEQAETIEDLRNGLHVVRTLLQMGRYQQACNAYSSDLARALSVNLEAHAERLSLLRPFFPKGWASKPEKVTEVDAFFLVNSAATSLYHINEAGETIALYSAALLSQLRRKNWFFVAQSLSNLSLSLASLNRLAKQERCILHTLDIATLTNNETVTFTARLRRLEQLVRIGQWEGAEAMWEVLDSMGRDWGRSSYIPGDVELSYAWFRFYQGTLTEEDLARAEALAEGARHRRTIRILHRLRGSWYLEQGQYRLAADSFREALRMAREIGQTGPTSEVRLALASFHLGELPNPIQEAQQLSAGRGLDHLALAELWFAIGDRAQAEKHALQAYKEAWADGEPYVWRYELDKAHTLLNKLGAEIPKLPLYDPAKDEKFSWEDELEAAIETLRAENTAKQTNKEE